VPRWGPVELHGSTNTQLDNFHSACTYCSLRGVATERCRFAAVLLTVEPAGSWERIEVGGKKAEMECHFRTRTQKLVEQLICFWTCDDWILFKRHA